MTLCNLTRDRAVSRIFHAQAYLARVAREGNDSERWCVSIAATHLHQLSNHTSPAVSRAARKACLRFGITAPVLVSMGDSA